MKDSTIRLSTEPQIKPIVCPSCRRKWDLIAAGFLIAGIIAVAVFLHDGASMQARDELATKCNEQITKCNEIVTKYNICAQKVGYESIWPNLTIFNVSGNMS